MEDKLVMGAMITPLRAKGAGAGLLSQVDLEHDPLLGWKGTGERRWTPPTGLVGQGGKERRGCPSAAGGREDKHPLGTITYGGEIYLAKRLCPERSIDSLSV